MTNGRQTLFRWQKISIVLGAIIILMCVPLVVIIDENSLTYHIVEVNDQGNLQYAIESCHKISGCELHGYRFDFDDHGLQQATDEYNTFIKISQVTIIVKVVK